LQYLLNNSCYSKNVFMGVKGGQLCRTDYTGSSKVEGPIF
jgi:hypothetical protein